MGELPHVFTGSVEHAIAHIEESIQGKVEPRFLRWYAVKLFERDDKVQAELGLDPELLRHIDEHVADCEKEMDDDAESIITNQRYAYINTVVSRSVKKKARTEHLTLSDKIDRIVTNRILALPHLRGDHGGHLHHRHGQHRLLLRHHGHRLDQRRPLRRDRAPGGGRFPCFHRLRRLAGGAHQ